MSNGVFRWIMGVGAVLAVAGLAAFFFKSGTVEPERWVDSAEEADIGDRRGALVDEVVFTQESDLGKIANLIESGSHQVFASGIDRPTIFRRLRDSVRADHDISYGSSAEITFNTAGPEFDDGGLNPFQNPKIREALNWLVDRRYIAEELYGGLAVPRYLPINTAFPDYARLAEVARRLELRYRHDPARAEAVIRREMEELGARFENGRWLYGGEPVVLGIVIRTDDTRRRVGDYLGNLMEDLGFGVRRLYRTAEEASRIWISGDPRAGAWHIYTGGWASQIINRDLGGNFDFYYTPRGRPEPLWQTYKPVPELDEISERLQRRDYETWDERQELMARAMELAMEDSARVWLIDQINIWPRARNVRLSVDLAGGIAGSALWPYTLRYSDRVGGRMVVGIHSVLTEPWNPIAGTNWIFDRIMIRALDDAVVLPDPFTGLFLPQRIERAEVAVREGVPVIRSLDWLAMETVPEIQVPGDAWIDWDSTAERFVTVDEKHPDGVTSRTRTRVVYEKGYLDRRWHDGTRVSLADLVLPLILVFDMADETSPLYDRSHVPVFEAFQRHFRGWRIVSRDPLVVEIYSDQIYPDAEWIVGARAPGMTSWHTLALGILAERSGELAFSSAKADQNEIDWMSLVSGPSLEVLDRQLERARSQAFVPYAKTLGDFLREGEAGERYAALADWRRERRHFWVGDGPFYLHSVHPVERMVVLRRFEGFPDRADKWLGFTSPEIPILDLEGPMIVSAGDLIEFELRILLGGDKPYPVEAIERVGYMVFDSRDRLVFEGEAEAGEAGLWKIALSGEQSAGLDSGANSLEVAVISRRVALPSFASHTFATIPRGTGQRHEP